MESEPGVLSYEYVEPPCPGDCLCWECTRDSIYEYWLDGDYFAE